MGNAIAQCEGADLTKMSVSAACRQMKPLVRAIMVAMAKEGDPPVTEADVDARIAKFDDKSFSDLVGAVSAEDWENSAKFGQCIDAGDSQGATDSMLNMIAKANNNNVVQTPESINMLRESLEGVAPMVQSVNNAMGLDGAARLNREAFSLYRVATLVDKYALSRAVLAGRFTNLAARLDSELFMAQPERDRVQFGIHALRNPLTDAEMLDNYTAGMPDSDTIARILSEYNNFKLPLFPAIPIAAIDMNALADDSDDEYDANLRNEYDANGELSENDANGELIENDGGGLV